MKTYTGHCRECGNVYSARSARAKFCSVPHEKEFNNRRMRRGALLYDLFMEGRFNREKSEKTSRSVMARIAMRFRDEDKAERDGRASWLPVGDKISVVDTQVSKAFMGQMSIGRKRL